MRQRDPLELSPLKPIVFHILIVLLDGQRHGWSLLKALESRLDARVLPGQLYRQIDAMLVEGLIEEHASPSRTARHRRDERTGGAAPTRFFQLTEFGRRVAAVEARRMERIVSELRSKRLLPQKGRS